METNRDEHGNVVRDADKPLVVLWPGTLMGDHTAQEFADFMKADFNVDAQFLEEVTTGPDREPSGLPIPGSGDRIDLLFAINPTTMGNFPVKRLAFGMRWLDDALDQDAYKIYPARLKQYLQPKDSADE